MTQGAIRELDGRRNKRLEYLGPPLPAPWLSGRSMRRLDSAMRAYDEGPTEKSTIGMKPAERLFRTEIICATGD